MLNQETELTDKQIMEYYDRADLLISKGYPVVTTNRYELAKIIAINELKRNEKFEDGRNTKYRNT